MLNIFLACCPACWMQCQMNHLGKDEKIQIMSEVPHHTHPLDQPKWLSSSFGSKMTICLVQARLLLFVFVKQLPNNKCSCHSCSWSLIGDSDHAVSQAGWWVCDKWQTAGVLALGNEMTFHNQCFGFCLHFFNDKIVMESNQQCWMLSHSLFLLDVQIDELSSQQWRNVWKLFWCCLCWFNQCQPADAECHSFSLFSHALTPKLMKCCSVKSVKLWMANAALGWFVAQTMRSSVLVLRWIFLMIGSSSTFCFVQPSSVKQAVLNVFCFIIFGWCLHCW